MFPDPIVGCISGPANALLPVKFGNNGYGWSKIVIGKRYRQLQPFCFLFFQQVNQENIR
jgi:hypothetical protein